MEPERNRKSHIARAIHPELSLFNVFESVLEPLDKSKRFSDDSGESNTLTKYNSQISENTFNFNSKLHPLLTSGLVLSDIPVQAFKRSRDSDDVSFAIWFLGCTYYPCVSGRGQRQSCCQRFERRDKSRSNKLLQPPSKAMHVTW